MEQWKDVPGYEGRYQASTQGRVRSYDCRINNRWNGQTIRHGRILKPEITSLGYLRVVLCSDAGKKRWAVHRLIAYTFLGAQSTDIFVNHIDGNPSNNSLDNLEYVTPKENIYHAIHVLGHSRTGELNSAAKMTEEQVSEIRSLFAGGDYTKRALGKQFGVSEVLVGKIIRRKIWQHVA